MKYYYSIITIYIITGFYLIIYIVIKCNPIPVIAKLNFQHYSILCILVLFFHNCCIFCLGFSFNIYILLYLSLSEEIKQNKSLYYADLLLNYYQLLKV